MTASGQTIRLKNQLAEIGRLSQVVDELAEAHGWSPKTAYEVNIALDELLTNTISYGHEDGQEHWIDVRLALENELLTMVIEDDGKAFDPLARPDPDLTQSLEDREIGGLGIYFVRKLMDSVDYQRVGDKNVVTIRKSVAPPAR